MCGKSTVSSQRQYARLILLPNSGCMKGAIVDRLIAVRSVDYVVARDFDSVTSTLLANPAIFAAGHDV